jgi:hypothetical protein
MTHVVFFGRLFLLFLLGLSCFVQFGDAERLSVRGEENRSGCHALIGIFLLALAITLIRAWGWFVP